MVDKSTYSSLILLIQFYSLKISLSISFLLKFYIFYYEFPFLGNTTSGDYMIYEKLKKTFHQTSDLKHKKIGKMNVVYLESLCSSDKINEYILKNVPLKKNYLFLRDVISGPSVVFLDDIEQASFYLMNGYALCYDKKTMLVCEVKADLYRAIAPPTVEPSINGPKDAFNESIQTNLGLIKRRVRSENLVNENFTIGKKSQTQVSLLYIEGTANPTYIQEAQKLLNHISMDSLIEIESLQGYLEATNSPMPTALKTERPDKVSTALFAGKVVIIADNSPFAFILPAYFADFINPQGDLYVKATNANFLKVLRFLCLIITIVLPGLYISIINYNPETIPLNLLLSFQAARLGVPFPSAIEALFMISVCSVLRESDIRFPNSYGSSISILGALILGEAAVSANVVSPIMIIIIGITFISALVFNSGNLIDGIRYYRLILLLCSTILGLYGFLLGCFILLLHLANMKTLSQPYLYPVAPFSSKYFFKSLLKKPKESQKEKNLLKQEGKL